MPNFFRRYVAAACRAIVSGGVGRMPFPAGFPVLFPSQLPMRVPVVGQVRCGLQDFLPHEADDVGAAVGLEANAFLFEQFPLLRPAGGIQYPRLPQRQCVTQFPQRPSLLWPR